MRSVPMMRPTPVTAATLAELVRLQRAARSDPEVIAARQLTRLRAAVEHARHAPYWRQRLRSLPPLETGDELWAVPPVDKATLRTVDHGDLLVGAPPAHSRPVRSTGTTGEPFLVWYPPGGAWWQGVLRLRVELEWGIRPWHRRVHVALPALPGRVGDSRPRRTWRGRWLGLPGGEDAAELAARIAAWRPATVTSAPHELVEVGEALGGRHSPRAVLTFGETLSPEMRAHLTRLYGVAPLDHYGTSEAGFVAWQCRARDLYHVNHEAVRVDLVDADERPAAPGITGEVVLTTLWNPLMPFVRYTMGDAAAWATRPCRCGSALPALAHVTGRTFRWLVDAAGRRVVPQRLWIAEHLGMEVLDRIHRYRVHQARDASVLVEVAASPADFTPDMERELARSYNDLLGPVPVTVRRVDALARPPGRVEVITSDAVVHAEVGGSASGG